MSWTPLRILPRASSPRAPGGVTLNPVTRLGNLSISATINPNGLPATAWIQYGIGNTYGNSTAPVPLGFGTNNVPASLPLAGLAPGLTWHYRVAATSAAGTAFGPDQIVNFSAPGDFNGDGIVSQSELDAVYGNYVTNSPWLYMTNVAGLGGTNVSFDLDNAVSGAYSVQYSTNLVDWLPLGPATPRYLFTDTNAPAIPQRYYRLSYP